MKSFEVPNLSVEEFAQRLLHALQRVGLGNWVTLTRNEGQIECRFSRFGTSVLRFETTARGRGFRAILKDRKVSLSHLPFAGEIETAVSRILEDLGAQPIT